NASATSFSLNSTATASACDLGEIGSLNNGACETNTTTVLPQPLASIVQSPVTSTLSVSQAEAFGTVTYGAITGFASGSASPSAYVTAGVASFHGEWDDVITVVSPTLAAGTPTNLLLTFHVAGTVNCTTESSAQVIGSLEYGSNGILNISD